MDEVKLINQENKTYFLQVKQAAGCKIVTLSDLKSVWEKNLSESEAIQNFKKDNPLIQSSDKWIAEYLFTIMKHVDSEIKINFLEENVQISFLSKISSLATKFIVSLEREPSEMIFKKITLPMVMLINELQFRQKLLLTVIKAKDIELKEFKLEGARIIRQNVTTEPFDEDNFEKECGTSSADRAKKIISNPCSVLLPSLSSLYSDFSSIVTSCVKEEKQEQLSNFAPKEQNGKTDNSDNKGIVKNEDDLALKRKMSEALSRTKRQKKNYKI